jgi:pimeloyl-ACP methyl ester carboxylesterase
MLARVLKIVWFAAVALTAIVVWASVRWLGPRFGAWPAGLGALLVVLSLHPLLIATHFVMSRLHGDPVPREHRLSFVRAIGMFDAEIDASMRGIWFATPFLSRRSAPTPAPDATRALGVLFVHGYFGNRANWLGFLDDAAARGYRASAITLDGIGRPIESHAAAIEAAIAALEARGARRVAIVAHSMGGLVVRSALPTIDPARVAHVVTLGTPHRGTTAARFGRGTNVTQMRLGSEWLADLEARERAAGMTHDRYTTVFSHHDDVVYPQTNACLPDAECVALGGIGHVSLLYDRRVRKVVFDVLARTNADLEAEGPPQAVAAAS